MTVLPLVADALIKASILLALTAGAALLLRRSTASLRHLVWTLGLTGALVAPILSAALPRWEIPLVTVDAAALAPIALIEDAPAAPPLHRPRADGAARTPSDPIAAAATPPPAPATFDTGLLRRIDWPFALMLLWTIGAAAILARLIVGVVAVAWISRRLPDVSDAPWLPLARGLAGELGLERVRFLQSGAASMPMAWGVIRPSVLMPADADSWPAERLRMVLLHELAHVKRRDCLTHVIAQLTCAAHWFNPLAWLAARRLRVERERACDDLVLAAGTRGSEYADGLLDVARVMRAGRFPAVFAGASLAMAHRTQLEGRLIAILDPTLPRQGRTRGRAAIAATTFAMLLLPIASVQPWTQAAALPPPSDGADARLAPDTSHAAQSAPDVKVKPREGIKGGVRGGVHGGVDRGIDGGVAGQIAGGIAGGIAGTITDGIVSATTSMIGDAIAMAIPQAQPAPAQPVQPPQQAKGRRSAEADARVTAALAEALKDPDKDVRETAMAALAQMKDPRVFDALASALHDSDADVREKAVFGLGQLRDRRAIEPLTLALKDASPDVREQAAFGLGQLRAREAVPALTLALKDEKANVREQAAFALGQLRDASAVDPLTSVLHDPSADVREQAVFALGQLRDARAIEPLISALKDESADVREQAAFALGQLRSDRAVEALVIALKDAKADVREQAAFALGQIRDPRAIDGLTSALKDQSADVRQQAAFALGQIR
jgi:HEAT repeat protein/beta-lactamase regulating signal transducer with metallopeptidase domain